LGLWLISVFPGSGLYIVLGLFIAPAGTRVFAVLGEDRVLYTPLDSELGKHYAVRVVKGSAWDIKLVRVGRNSPREARYTVPVQFARRLSLSKGDYVLATGTETALEVVPLRVVLERIGRFREPVPHTAGQNLR